MKSEPAKLTLGPVHYNWSVDKWRDFYFRIADEAPLDTVYVGEVVCSKRQPFFDPVIAGVIERLQAGGKEVVLSSLALVMTKRELMSIEGLAQDSDLMIEANDISAISLLENKAHVIGPFINVYNEDTLSYLAARGATRVCLPFELPKSSISAIADARPKNLELEVQVFGMTPLAISARCYHARSRGLSKDSCQYVCADDPEGLAVETLDGASFLTVNGTQTLSDRCELLVGELDQLLGMGVSRFRLSPMDRDMVAIAKQYRDLADHCQDAEATGQNIRRLLADMPVANGFFHGQEGNAYQSQAE